MAAVDQVTAVRHMAEYFTPGTLMAETDRRSLPDRSVDAAITRAPAPAFAFILYDLAVVDFDYDEECFRVVPKRLNVSKRYYLGGEIHTLAGVEAMGEQHRILAFNMQANGWERVIQTRCGNWQPFEDGDVRLEP